MKIVRLILTILILMLSACSSGGAPTARISATPTVEPAAGPTVTPTREAMAGDTPTPTAEPTARPSPIATPTAKPAPPEPASAGPCWNPYYPVVAGASWEYQLSGPTRDTFVRSITRVGENGFNDQDVFSSGTVRQGGWECREGNLISLTPAPGPSVDAAGMQMNFTVESNTGITFPADPQPGRAWGQKVVLMGQFEREGKRMETRNVMEVSCRAASTEKVSVPAGDFEALRVDCSTKMDISFSGVPAFSMTDTTMSWYARGIGWVKSKSSSNTGVTEIVLLSYTIP